MDKTIEELIKAGWVIGPAYEKHGKFTSFLAYKGWVKAEAKDSAKDAFFGDTLRELIRKIQQADGNPPGLVWENVLPGQ